MDRKSAKQIIYGIGFLLVFFAILTGVYFIFLKPAPSCFDNKQNGNETGIDCGGQCMTCGIKNTLSLEISWTKSFSNGAGKMILASEIKNPNLNYGAKDFSYSFDVYGKGGEKSGYIGHSFIYAGEVKYLLAPIDFDSNNFFRAELNFSDANWILKDDFVKPQITLKEFKIQLLNTAQASMSAFNFTRDLFSGLKGEDVKMLEEFLKSQGYFKGIPNTLFDSTTKVALVKYQKVQKLPATGYFGGKTRESINSAVETIKQSVPETGLVYPAIISGLIKNDDIVSASKVIINGFIFDKLGMLTGVSKTELENINPTEEKNFRIIFPQNINTQNINQNLTKVYVDAIK
ncbi:MAG: peptidoglycan-binding domain-containing protein [Patescibacteria group bacterium]|nr:peptidoglycan-binding domain-containing protein [Patescibacteria group bacterium]